MRQEMIARDHHNPRLGVGGPNVPPPKYPSRLHPTIGQRLRQHRLAAGLTQDEAAAAAGIRGSAWCLFERGRALPTLSTLQSLAAAVGCHPADLLA